MSITTYRSGGDTYDITVTTPPPDGKRYPIVLYVHGNAGLTGSSGTQISAFAALLSAKGYNTAIPKYYLDNEPHLTDTQTKENILADAVAALATLPTVDSSRVGIVGFSLGAASSMSLIADKPAGTIAVFANFFGFITPAIRFGVSKFPPTVIFHNKNDRIVDVQNSRDLDRLLPAAVQHELVEYDEQHLEVNHAFRPDGPADLDSKSRTVSWFQTHMPPDGV